MYPSVYSTTMYNKLEVHENIKYIMTSKNTKHPQAPLRCIKMGKIICPILLNFITFIIINRYGEVREDIFKFYINTLQLEYDCLLQQGRLLLHINS